MLHQQSIHQALQTDRNPLASAGLPKVRELLPTRAGVTLSLSVVRTKIYKLSLDSISGAGELYDLVENLNEMHNRCDDVSYSANRDELITKIKAREADETGQRVQVGLTWIFTAATSNDLTNRTVSPATLLPVWQ